MMIVVALTISATTREVVIGTEADLTEVGLEVQGGSSTECSLNNVSRDVEDLIPEMQVQDNSGITLVLLIIEEEDLILLVLLVEVQDTT